MVAGLCAAFATPAADHAAAADVQLRALAFYDACIQVRATGGSLSGAGELAGKLVELSEALAQLNAALMGLGGGMGPEHETQLGAACYAVHGCAMLGRALALPRHVAYSVAQGGLRLVLGAGRAALLAGLAAAARGPAPAARAGELADGLRAAAGIQLAALHGMACGLQPPEETPTFAAGVAPPRGLLAWLLAVTDALLLPGAPPPEGTALKWAMSYLPLLELVMLPPLHHPGATPALSPAFRLAACRLALTRLLPALAAAAAAALDAADGGGGGRGVRLPPGTSPELGSPPFLLERVSGLCAMLQERDTLMPALVAVGCHADGPAAGCGGAAALAALAEAEAAVWCCGCEAAGDFAKLAEVTERRWQQTAQAPALAAAHARTCRLVHWLLVWTHGDALVARLLPDGGWCRLAAAMQGLAAAAGWAACDAADGEASVWEERESTLAQRSIFAAHLGASGALLHALGDRAQQRGTLVGERSGGGVVRGLGAGLGAVIGLLRGAGSAMRAAEAPRSAAGYMAALLVVVPHDCWHGADDALLRKLLAAVAAERPPGRRWPDAAAAQRRGHMLTTLASLADAQPRLAVSLVQAGVLELALDSALLAAACPFDAQYDLSASCLEAYACVVQALQRAAGEVCDALEAGGGGGPGPGSSSSAAAAAAAAAADLAARLRAAQAGFDALKQEAPRPAGQPSFAATGGTTTEEMAGLSRRLLPAAAELAALTRQGWQASPLAAAARGCAYLACASLGGEGGAEAGQGGGSRRCSGCRVAWYCGTECSHADWRAGHKRVCKALAAERVAERAAERERAAVRAQRAAGGSERRTAAEGRRERVRTPPDGAS
ncbi:hypothetical protein CHLNCDRAFT_141006 [Chlorella variabilis]|uniref:MYND-type domain-containing protein n=1 Tax=Chlorella variabilis TaxID=554065 RepID=E1ZRZ0_CHLVA|nr:hypothetical protein CHLNCDRAFT_141006 [Chlorella variabilis]EFN51388.1 hypothetical protein CHLNCDRAFT_141006 [Chlorella variabilis]|eukprot:XP_005843490.1 hypothetical protein CHLNCDRAFT_141006 [Chlorella variabilis]